MRQVQKLEGPFQRLLVFLVLIVVPGSCTSEPAEWVEPFSEGRLNPAHWEITAQGDFRGRSVDVVDTNKRGTADFRLRLRADTRGTQDDTVKFLGVRSRRSFRLAPNQSISTELDWNDQANGSYLTASLVLAPHATTGNPLTGREWLKVEYVGVPPGLNARLVVAVKVHGREQTLFTEGWPDKNRSGRSISVQDIEVVIGDPSFQIWENRRLVYESNGKKQSFDVAYVYLQMSSHSNYPSREIYFDNIRISRSTSP